MKKGKKNGEKVANTFIGKIFSFSWSNIYNFPSQYQVNLNTGTKENFHKTKLTEIQWIFDEKWNFL